MIVIYYDVPVFLGVLLALPAENPQYCGVQRADWLGPEHPAKQPRASDLGDKLSDVKLLWHRLERPAYCRGGDGFLFYC